MSTDIYINDAAENVYECEDVTTPKSSQKHERECDDEKSGRQTSQVQSLTFKLVCLLTVFNIAFIIAIPALYFQSEAKWQGALQREIQKVQNSQNKYGMVQKPVVATLNQTDDRIHEAIANIETKMENDIGCSIGLKNKVNSKVTLSSSRPFSHLTSADSARLDGQASRTSNGSWCGKQDGRAWIDVKFSTNRLIAGVVTQGNPSGDQWVKTFKAFCGDEGGDYTEYTENGVEKIFQANSDRNGKSFNIFADLLSCRSIKIVPSTWNSRPCLRMELLHAGCYPSRVYNFYVKSQGADDGWSCHITVNGVQKAVRKRGICVVIFNPATRTFDSDTFDTYEQSTTETTRLISFLNNAAQ